MVGRRKDWDAHEESHLNEEDHAHDESRRARIERSDVPDISTAPFWGPLIDNVGWSSSQRLDWCGWRGCVLASTIRPFSMARARQLFSGASLFDDTHVSMSMFAAPKHVGRRVESGRSVLNFSYKMINLGAGKGSTPCGAELVHPSQRKCAVVGGVKRDSESGRFVLKFYYKMINLGARRGQPLVGPSWCTQARENVGPTERPFCA